MVNAPRDLVFKAYSVDELLSSWWGPQGWQTQNRQFEFKPNGVWLYCMRCVDQDQGEFYGMESWGKSIYHEIIAPEKIIYTDMFSDKDGNPIEGMPEIRVTMLFTEKDGNTQISVHNKFPSTETLHFVMEMGLVQGYASQLERLDELITKLK
ncbi:MAG: SRPBCC domain-containing protein [Bacillus sp. (in: firmicutes)]